MPTRDVPRLADYGVALLTVAVAIAVRALLTPLMGPAFPLATAFAAVAFSSWYSGWKPALLTAVAAFLTADYFFIPGATRLFGRPLVGELVNVSVYLLTCGSVIVLGEAGRRARRRLEAEQRSLATANFELGQQVEAHALLAAIVASTGDSIISTTLGGVITSWNAGAEQLLGYTADEAIGRDVAMLIPPDRASEDRVILERVRAGGHVDHLDTARLTKSGERRDVSLTASPVYSRHGLVVGASMVARDITQRKAVERERRRTEDEQALLVAIHDATRGLQEAGAVMLRTAERVGTHFAVSRCAYGEVDLDTQSVLITRGFTRDVPTVAGRYSLHVFGPELIATLRTGRTVTLDDVRTSPLTNAPAVAEVYAHMQIVALAVAPLIRAGRLVAILVMADRVPRPWSPADAALLEQIAQRTLFAVESARAATALRESRDVLALAMAAARMGAWSRDIATGVSWWSPELEAIFGLPVGTFEGAREAFRHLVHPDDQAAVNEAIATAIATHQDYSIEFRYRHASGEWRWMEGRGRAVYAADGEARMLYGLGIDITERRAAVEALHEADRRKDEFLATLAHELRNPLAPITAGLHILRRAGHDGGEAAVARDVIERQVAQMVRLVDDLLDVARISTGKTELRAAPMDLAEAVRDAVETSRPLLQAAEQPLEVSLPATPVLVHADRTRLAQVFSNLLNNSAKFSGRQQPIAISVARDGNDAMVRVRDAGAGIDPAHLPSLFEMFRQAEGVGRRSQGGLGIGLFLVRRIVEMHGGRVAAHSDGPGRGSEFVVRLPALTAPVVEPTPADADPVFGAAPARRRVLVVDDNADAAELLAMVLGLDGHETRMAHDGDEAMAVAQHYRPDVIFLDIGMPNLDGHETARQVRAQPWGRDVVLVALTGWGQAEDRRRSKDAGFDHHLVKPADPDAIARLLASLTPAGPRR